MKKFEYTLPIDTLKEIAIRFEQLKDRTINPTGDFDKGGRFYLNDKHDCCKGIRTPSRAFPYSEMLHGRTLLHICYENGLTDENLTEVRKYINSQKPKRVIEKHYCYKKVAIDNDGNFVSLYDKKFIWQLNKKSEKLPIDFSYGYYGFSEIEPAIKFQMDSKDGEFTGFEFNKFVILLSECSKKSNEISPFKFEYEWIKPIEIVFSLLPRNEVK